MSASSFLENNDFTVTALYFYFDLCTDNPLNIHSSPHMLIHVFERKQDRAITVMNEWDHKSCDITSCVRMMFKIYKMGLTFSFVKI